MPKKLSKYLEGDNIYGCKKCGAHLSSLSSLISTAFTGQSGSAYLFNDVVNVRLGKKERKQLRTGVHQIASLFCHLCDNDHAIGWKYFLAEQASEKYKEGKFILEKAYLEKQFWISD